MRDKEGKEGEKGMKTKNFVITILIIGCLTLVGVFVIPWSTIFPPEPTVTPALSNSSIIMTDWTSKEILDELCPVAVYGDKGEITNIDERYDITFYEIISTEVMPADFDEDLSEYDYIMIRPNPDEATDGWWTTYDYFYPNFGNNINFNMFAYHEATDLYGNVLDVEGGDEWDKTTSGNYTIPLWYPTVTTTEPHQGRYFTIEDDIADLSAKTLADLYNEKYYRNMPTLFSLADDTCTHGLSGEYEWITETSAIEIVFNDTISTTDAAITQVNFTGTCDYDVLIEIHNDTLYAVLTETWGTFYSNFEFAFEISMGTNISCSSVKAGRVVIPGRFFGTDYTFTSRQTLA